MYQLWAYKNNNDGFLITSSERIILQSEDKDAILKEVLKYKNASDVYDDLTGTSSVSIVVMNMNENIDDNIVLYENTLPVQEVISLE